MIAKRRTSQKILCADNQNGKENIRCIMIELKDGSEDGKHARNDSDDKLLCEESRYYDE